MQPNGPFNLTGKVALVTSCKRGIGLAMAVGLAEAGADFVGVSATRFVEGGEVGREVRALGCSFRGHACDCFDRKALMAFIGEVKSEVPRVDILVDNEGAILRKPAAEHPHEMWDKVIEVNLSAKFIFTREIGRELVARGSEKVIVTASLLTFQGGITATGYATSRGGIGQITMAFANEWASKGVNVNSIAPGYISTDNTEVLRNDPMWSAQILARIPAGRWGEPDALNGPAVFLASDAARDVHGTILLVDGGWMGR